MDFEALVINLSRLYVYNQIRFLMKDTMFHNGIYNYNEFEGDNYIHFNCGRVIIDYGEAPEIRLFNIAIRKQTQALDQCVLYYDIKDKQTKPQEERKINIFNEIINSHANITGRPKYINGETKMIHKETLIVCCLTTEEYMNAMMTRNYYSRKLTDKEIKQLRQQNPYFKQQLRKLSMKHPNAIWNMARPNDIIKVRGEKMLISK